LILSTFENRLRAGVVYNTPNKSSRWAE